jgi:ribose-phosphate pyrophosphokinase
LREAIATQSGADVGEVETQTFPDGELYQRILTPVEGRDVVLVAGTVSDGDTMELYDLSCSLVSYGSARLILVAPYFGHSTMERAVKPGEVVTAKTRAHLLSSIPGWNTRILLLDLHSEGLPHYFEGPIRPVHVYAKPVVMALAKKLGGDDFVLACTDAGRAKWVESLANDLGVGASFVFKRRLDGNRTQVTAMSANVEGKRVVIYDDMIRTGGSLLGAARAYREAGASDVVAIATHGIFPGDALGEIERSGLLSIVACTDSHPRARELAQGSRFLQVHSVAAVLAQALAAHLLPS